MPSKVHWSVIAGVLVVLLFGSVPVNAQSSIEKAVRMEFSDAPIMVAIARCESRFRQFSSSSRPLYNGQGSSAVGVFQIMESVHGKKARSLGHDIRETGGNLKYARYLYQKEGTRPWSASKHCWG